jgi:hypothetical protein
LASNASLIKRIEALEQLLHTKGYQRPLSPLETARLLAHISAGDPDFAAQVDALGLDITGEIARFEAKQAQAPSTIKKASGWYSLAANIEGHPPLPDLPAHEPHPSWAEDLNNSLAQADPPSPQHSTQQAAEQNCQRKEDAALRAAAMPEGHLTRSRKGRRRR